MEYNGRSDEYVRPAPEYVRPPKTGADFGDEFAIPDTTIDREEAAAKKKKKEKSLLRQFMALAAASAVALPIILGGVQDDGLVQVALTDAQQNLLYDLRDATAGNGLYTADEYQLLFAAGTNSNWEMLRDLLETNQAYIFLNDGSLYEWNSNTLEDLAEVDASVTEIDDILYLWRSEGDENGNKGHLEVCQVPLVQSTISGVTTFVDMQLGYGDESTFYYVQSATWDKNHMTGEAMAQQFTYPDATVHDYHGWYIQGQVDEYGALDGRCSGQGIKENVMVDSNFEVTMDNGTVVVADGTGNDAVALVTEGLDPGYAKLEFSSLYFSFTFQVDAEELGPAGLMLTRQIPLYLHIYDENGEALYESILSQENTSESN